MRKVFRNNYKTKLNYYVGVIVINIYYFTTIYLPINMYSHRIS